jgi:hypothetical protein
MTMEEVSLEDVFRQLTMDGGTDAS